MTKKIGKNPSLLIACLLIMLLLSGSVSTAEGLLGAMMDIAQRAGRTIEGTIQIDAADLLTGLGVSPEASEEPAIAAMNELLANGLLRVQYTEVDEGSVIDVALELREETAVSLRIRSSAEEIALETNLLPGKTLVMPAQLLTEALTAQMSEMLSGEMLAALTGSAERYTMIIADWVMQNEDVYNAMDNPFPATQTRDAAARSVTLRVTDEQWQQLFKSLLEEFSNDAALQQALALQLGGMEPDEMAAMALQLANSFAQPQGSLVQATAYLDEEDQIVGIDVTIEPPASIAAYAEKPLEGNFAYGHRTIDEDHAADSYDAAFTWGEISALQARFSRQDKVPNQLLPDEGEKYLGTVFLHTPDTGGLELQAQGDIRLAVDPIAEAYDHTFDAQLSLASEPPEASSIQDLSKMLYAPLLNVGFTLSSQTEVVDIEDFKSQGSFTLRLMGIEAAIHYTLESFAYVPGELSENTVFNLLTLTQAEADAITQELSENVMLQLENLMSPSFTKQH